MNAISKELRDLKEHHKSLSDQPNDRQAHWAMVCGAAASMIENMAAHIDGKDAVTEINIHNQEANDD